MQSFSKSFLNNETRWIKIKSFSAYFSDDKNHIEISPHLPNISPTEQRQTNRWLIQRTIPYIFNEYLHTFYSYSLFDLGQFLVIIVNFINFLFCESEFIRTYIKALTCVERAIFYGCKLQSFAIITFACNILCLCKKVLTLSMYSGTFCRWHSELRN